MTGRLFRIYLQDHHAAASAGVGIARRALKGPVKDVAEQIAADRRTLEEVMRCVDVAPSTPKIAGAKVLQHLARLKLNGRLWGRSDLDSLLDLETLVVGITGKRSLWAALAQLPDERLAGFDFAALVSSAEEQAVRVEDERLRAARAALAGDRPRVTAGVGS